MIKHVLTVVAVLIGTCWCANPMFDTRSVNAGTKAGSLMTTNIALVGADPAQTRTSDSQNLVIDSSNLVDQKALDEKAEDIDEDDYDRFITTRSGKKRVVYRDEEENWNEEAGSAMGTPVGRPLNRVKRCDGGGGGGGGGDDGGSAERGVSRRWGRVSRGRSVSRRRNVSSNNVKSKKKKKKKKKTTTVTTTKVISNGQVVSQTSSTSGQTAPTVQAVAATAAPQIVHQQPPVVVSRQQQPVVAGQPQTVVVSQQPQPNQQAVIPPGQAPAVTVSHSLNVSAGK